MRQIGPKPVVLQTVLLGLDRRIVGIQVTGQTIGELGMQRGIMRHLTVALAALGDHRMLLMAGHARNLGMLALAAGPDTINAGVATGAGFQFGVLGEDNLPGLMHRMAGETAFQRLLGIMPLVADEAGRNIAVALAVAVDTGNHGVLARELLKLGGRSGVTRGAVLGQAVGEGHTHRFMGIAVTGKALGLSWAMGQGMATLAFGHDFGPVVAIGVVRMVNDMTVDTIELMTTALGLERLEVGTVTGSALSGGHLFDGSIVGITDRRSARGRRGESGRSLDSGNGRRLGRGRRRRLRFGNRLDAGNRQHHQSHDRQQRYGSAYLFLLSLHENLSFASRHLKCA